MFDKIFIVENEPSSIQLLTTSLSTAMNKDDIILISEIDSAFKQITSQIQAGRKYAAFIDVYWDFDKRTGIELAENLSHYASSMKATMKLIGYTKVFEEIAEELDNYFCILLDKKAADPHPGAITLADIKRDFLIKLANEEESGMLHLNRKGKGNEILDKEINSYFFKTVKKDKISGQFLAVDFYDYSGKNEDEQLYRFEKLQDSLMEVLNDAKYHDVTFVILITGDGAIIGILKEEIRAIALEVAFDLISPLRRNNIHKELRFGIHFGKAYMLTGEKGETQLIGPGINHSVRVESASEPGKILISEEYFSVYIDRQSEDFKLELTVEEDAVEKKVKKDKFYARFVSKGKKGI
ncbi:MAG: adenylate/guanylate cyclase domain-containing protein [Desulfobacteraceae bacterium]|nr:adenylate/guanylate cyclase domain-containing protein [Desulfobacteraceae bacterium]